MEHANRISEHVLYPTPDEIEAECELIRSQWSPEMKNERRLVFRLDEANKQAQANLRFLRFLAEFADS